MMRRAAALGAWFGFLYVVFGAFGAHGFKARLAETGYAAQWETAVHYHGIHALAWVAAAMTSGAATVIRKTAIWSFAAGIVLFSGSLYALGLTGVKAWGAVTPFGGLGFLLGWALWAVDLAKERRGPSA